MTASTAARDTDRIAAAASVVLVSGLGLFGLHRLLAPAPLPLVGAVAAGTLALIVFDGRWRPIASAAILGAAVGALSHLGSHLTEGRVDSPAATTMHVLVDLLAGCVLGGFVLGCAWWTNHRLQRDRRVGQTP